MTPLTFGWKAIRNAARGIVRYDLTINGYRAGYVDAVHWVADFAPRLLLGIDRNTPNLFRSQRCVDWEQGKTELAAWFRTKLAEASQ